MQNIVSQVVYEPARSSPQHVAIVTRVGEVFTYAQLAVAVGQLAGHLRSCGLQPGQLAGISMAGHPLHLLTLLALAQIGAVSMPLHPALPPERRQLLARKFGVSCVVSESRDFELAGLGFVGLDSSQFRADGPADAAIHPVPAEHPMHILVTSGTTGDPKGMVLSHGNVASRNQTWEPQGQGPNRVLQADLNFLAGFGPAMRALAHGDALVFPLSPAAEHVLLALLTQRITHAYLSPQQASLLVGLVGANVANACPHLLSLRIVGEHLSAPLRDTLSRRLTANVYVVYGSAEAGVVTTATPDMLARHPQAVGTACNWAEIQVVDAAGRELPRGHSGEVRIRSRHLVDGYHADQAHTQARFRDGWFYPGDSGRFDAEGLLYIEGRTDDLMNVGGVIVDPEGVEQALCGHPAVAEAGAFVWATPAGQAFLSVALVLRDPGRLDEVRAFAQEKLGPLAPARYEQAKALPRTTNGKLQRNQLAAMFPAA